MKKAIFGIWIFAVLWLAAAPDGRTAPAGFQKITPHFYYLESKSGAANTCALITTEGVVLIDPPPEAEIPALMNSLKVLTTRTIRWVVNTDYQQALSGGSAAFAKLGAAVIGSKELDRLAGAMPPPPDPNLPAPAAASRPNPRFLFGQQLHLWPAGIEVRILAVKTKARTAGDVVVYVPAEKVLVTGDFFAPGKFPAIDNAGGEGTARGWIEGLKQVIDFVPILKSAMPQPKADPVPVPEPEKTLEEMMLVMPGHGPASNMQQVKSLWTAAQKLRTEANRAITAGRTREDFLKSLSPDVFGEFGNLEPFAALLYDDLAKK
jgi:glyoxylase-like metal-dependent hydrolase (beta-lactamase superfamily II)